MNTIQNTLESLKQAVLLGGKRAWWESLLATVGLPILEGVLINLWTAGTSSVPLICLIVIGIFHLALAALLLANQSVGDAGALLRLHESEERIRTLEGEFQRRNAAYRVICKATKAINRQTCFFGGEEHWCQGGFQKELMPVVTPFLSEIRMTLGVSSESYTFEVYLEHGLVDCQQLDVVDELGLMFFFGPPKNDEMLPGGLTHNSPVRLGWARRVPGEHSIESDRQLFYDGQKVCDEVYFRRYATVPITEICSDYQQGLLVLTSMQNEAFASDCIETLSFIAQLISHFYRCLCSLPERLLDTTREDAKKSGARATKTSRHSSNVLRCRRGHCGRIIHAAIGFEVLKHATVLDFGARPAVQVEGSEMNLNQAKTTQIFLPTGEPRGIRVAELTTHIVQAVAIPCSDLATAKTRAELDHVAVYFLFGESEGAAKPIVYIGQTEDVRKRLDQHNANKDFWQTAVLGISRTHERSSGSLTTAHGAPLSKVGFAIERSSATKPITHGDYFELRCR